jgi:hypothetical protein
MKTKRSDLVSKKKKNILTILQQLEMCWNFGYMSRFCMRFCESKNVRFSIFVLKRGQIETEDLSLIFGWPLSNPPSPTHPPPFASYNTAAPGSMNKLEDVVTNTDLPALYSRIMETATQKTLH